MEEKELEIREYIKQKNRDIDKKIRAKYKLNCT